MQVLDELGIDFGGLQDAPQTQAAGVSNAKADDQRLAARKCA